MPALEVEAQIEKLYTDILGRASDEEGLAYWVGLMEDGTPLGAISHEFLAVRLAADKAAFDAVLEKLSSPSPGGASVEVIAEQAYRLFLDNLTALDV